MFWESVVALLTCYSKHQNWQTFHLNSIRIWQGNPRQGKQYKLLIHCKEKGRKGSYRLKSKLFCNLQNQWCFKITCYIFASLLTPPRIFKSTWSNSRLLSLKQGSFILTFLNVIVQRNRFNFILSKVNLKFCLNLNFQHFNK